MEPKLIEITLQSLSTAQLIAKLNRYRADMGTDGKPFDIFVVLKEGAKAPGPYATLADAKAASAVTLNIGIFINAIINFARILAAGMRGPVSADQLDYLTRIRQSGDHLLGLINDVLDLSKIEAGKMTLEADSVSVPELIEGICRVLRGVTLPRRIQLVVDIASDVSTIEADPIKLKQILYNLISNAVKFSPDAAAVRIAARFLHSEESPIQRDAIQVSVVDQGIGIDPKDHEMIFEQFRQVQGNSKRPQGTGLGLTLVKHFLEMHGGAIRVKSEPGRGSDFTFVLPRWQAGETHV